MYEIINAIFYAAAAGGIIVAGITMGMLTHSLRKDSRKLTHKNKKYFIKERKMTVHRKQWHVGDKGYYCTNYGRVVPVEIVRMELVGYNRVAITIRLRIGDTKVTVTRDEDAMCERLFRTEDEAKYQ